MPHYTWTVALGRPSDRCGYCNRALGKGEAMLLIRIYGLSNDLTRCASCGQRDHVKVDDAAVTQARDAQRLADIRTRADATRDDLHSRGFTPASEMANTFGPRRAAANDREDA